MIRRVLRSFINDEYVLCLQDWAYVIIKAIFAFRFVHKVGAVAYKYPIQIGFVRQKPNFGNSVGFLQVDFHPYRSISPNGTALRTATKI